MLEISFESGACCEDLVGWLVDRLGDKSCHIKLKVMLVFKAFALFKKRFCFANHISLRVMLYKYLYSLLKKIKCTGIVEISL